MGRYLKNLPFCLSLALIVLVSAGCASGHEENLFIVPDFRQQDISAVILLPVTFEERYAPPFELDLAGELESRARAALEEKGYRVSRGSLEGGAAAPAAVMRIHVDFFFLTETWADSNPPPVIDIEALGQLVSDAGELLWKDRGIGEVGGAGGDPIRRPASALHMALSLLIENLFDSLPDAQDRD